MADSVPVRKRATKAVKTAVPGSLDKVEDVPERVVAAAVEALFATILSQRAPGAMRVARRALEYSRLDSEEWIVGRDSLLFAILSIGADDPNAHKASSWFFQWLRSSKPAVLKELLEAAGQRRNEPGAVALVIVEIRRPRLSDALANSVGRRAIDYAVATVGRKHADLRHLLFALLDFPDFAVKTDGRLSPGQDIKMGDQDIRELKTYLVDQIEKSPEQGEKVDVWRQIADGSFVAPPRPLTTPAVPDEDERTGFQTDEPAQIDELDREGFADALVQLVVQVREKNQREVQSRAPGPDPNHAFMMHLDGPWGTGKSSVLNFMRAKLRDKNWLVVDFNAWKLQRLEPAWWTVITHIQHASLEQAPGWLARAKLWSIARLSRLRFVGLPLLFGGVLLAGLVWLGVLEFTANASEAFKALAAIIAALGTLFAFSRTLLFGASNAAQSYEALQSDPYRTIMAHFETLVRSVDRPIIVLIDDLDRCDGAYVVALIESIQTMLRGMPIVYLVAADRQWIRTSFEAKYKDFGGQAPDPGRPLGYLFLEKIFQVSTTLPTMSPALKQRYWSGLVGGPRGAAAAADAAAAEPPPSEAAIAEAVAQLLKRNSHAGLQAGIRAEPNAAVRRRLKRAAAEHLASPIVQQRTEGRLARHPELMDANPRAMKRLLSAVTMTGARMMTEEREVSLEQIARWAALELRWPLLAMRLALYPDLLRASEGAGEAPFSGTPDPALDALLAGNAVQAVIGSPGDAGTLDRAALGKLLF